MTVKAVYIYIYSCTISCEISKHTVLLTAKGDISRSVKHKRSLRPVGVLGAYVSSNLRSTTRDWREYHWPRHGRVFFTSGLILRRKDRSSQIDKFLSANLSLFTRRHLDFQHSTNHKERERKDSVNSHAKDTTAFKAVIFLTGVYQTFSALPLERFKLLLPLRNSRVI